MTDVVIEEGSTSPYLTEGQFMEAADGWYVVSNGKWAKTQTFHVWLDMPAEKLAAVRKYLACVESYQEAMAHFRKDPHYQLSTPTCRNDGSQP